MAYITNLEKNICLEITFCKNHMFDCDPHRSDDENWIPFVLSLTLPDRFRIIEENADATLNISEIKYLLSGLENILYHFKKQDEYVFEFYSSEAFFELNLRTFSEDDVVEIEIWINVGNQTNGRIYGYDEGVRFVSDESAILNFYREIKRELAGFGISVSLFGKEI